MNSKKKIILFLLILIVFSMPLVKKVFGQEEDNQSSKRLTINADTNIFGHLSINKLSIGDDYKTVFNSENITDDREYTLPNLSGEICLSSGNCELGEGDKFTGTQNQLARFTDSGMDDSSITDMAEEESVIINENGDLGVGLNPDYKIHSDGDICTDMGGGICLGDMEEMIEEATSGDTMDELTAEGEGTPDNLAIWREDGLGDSIINEKDRNIGIGTTPREKLDVSGTIRVLGFRLPVSPEEGYGLVSDSRGVGSWKPVLHPDEERMDVAERFPCTDCPEKGELVSITGEMEVGRPSKEYDSNLLGVVSTAPALTLSSELNKNSSVAVALSGRVPAKVNLEGGKIKPGDPLTSSDKPGVAKKANSSGRVVGLALESFSGNKEKIKVFVNPHYLQASESADKLKMTDQETDEDYCIELKGGEFVKEKCE